ncbi:hypothetical protein BDV19DRAFT_392086 [Aspergillus venezuelensis]
MRLQSSAFRLSASFLALSLVPGGHAAVTSAAQWHNPRERHSKTIPDGIIYDYRPDANDTNLLVLKPCILSSRTDYIQNGSDKHQRLTEEPDIDIPYVDVDFDDSEWDIVRLPHDWAIKGPFYTEDDPEISGDMSRLPVQGVGWYRRTIQVYSHNLDNTVYLEVDGAISYPMVWLNGHLVGGWPYGYNSFQLDLTPYLRRGKNQIAIRVENPSGPSSRWHPGGGIYRNVPCKGQRQTSTFIFPEWREPDLRAFIRRDRNHPSVIVWSYGNEVGEQGNYDAETAKIAKYLRGVVVQEDTTRPSTGSMHRSTPTSLYTDVVDIISLNYQGEGMRYGPAYEHLVGNRKTPQYQAFHEAHPDKLVFGSEVAWSLSSRRTFLFPVTNYTSSPINDTTGRNSSSPAISAYEMYSSDSGSSPDRVFATQDEHPFVAGGFVWAGWDYLGEPYPYDGARSAYSGITDLAGFKKERYYLYQARWRPDFPMAHIVPHWTWPDRVGQVTPVHVFTSGDEAELFLKGVSQGRLKKEPLAYRLRWDDVIYEPGEVHVVTYKDGKKWATDTVRTAGEPASLRLTADRSKVASDGENLSFLTVEVIDSEGNFVPEADKLVRLSLSGPGEIVATDNGSQADFTPFPSDERKTLKGLALCVVRAEVGASRWITIRAESEAIEAAEFVIHAF